MQASFMIDRLVQRSPAVNFRWVKAKLLRKIPLASFEDDYPAVFVLSTGRVGSQTLQALLALSGRLLSLHEPAPRLYALSKLNYARGSHGSECTVFQEAWRTCRRELLMTALKLHRGYVETSPQGTFLATVIREVIPGAKFIHLIRSPLDVVRSGMRRRWYRGHPSDSTRIVPLSGSPDFVAWQGYSDLEKNVWLWKETNNWIFEFCSRLPETDVLWLKAEDMFEGHSRSMEDLFRFVRAPVPREGAIRRILGAKLNAQKSGVFSVGDRWTPAMKETLEKIAGPTINRAGYSV